MTSEDLKAAIFTRAKQIAAGELKQLARDQGTRVHEIRIHDRPRTIARHLVEHPEIVERARRDIEAWFGKRSLKRTPKIIVQSTVRMTIGDHQKPVRFS